ncbi:hypothetical protein BM221_003359 [Beauveria bassiana]|uniref:Uncharacterized protein n=1 Tax=Beauveria bassiana TaxID=176275 RepID=A0A2N6NUG4_BEABA|nr:hypothetical protein BM221_003359 [Beauveria bassiana]
MNWSQIPLSLPPVAVPSFLSLPAAYAPAAAAAAARSPARQHTYCTYNVAFVSQLNCIKDDDDDDDDDDNAVRAHRSNVVVGGGGGGQDTPPPPLCPAKGTLRSPDGVGHGGDGRHLLNIVNAEHIRPSLDSRGNGGRGAPGASSGILNGGDAADECLAAGADKPRQADETGPVAQLVETPQELEVVRVRLGEAEARVEQDAPAPDAGGLGGGDAGPQRGGDGRYHAAVAVWVVGELGHGARGAAHVHQANGRAEPRDGGQHRRVELPRRHVVDHVGAAGNGRRRDTSARHAGMDRMSSTTGNTRAASSSAVTSGRPGAVDCPPTSMMVAPPPTMSRMVADRSGAAACLPPSEKESGVRLRMAMMRDVRLGVSGVSGAALAEMRVTEDRGSPTAARSLR